MTKPIYTQEQMLRIRNENFAAGVDGECERIIKLLQEHQPEVGSDSGFVYCTCGVYEIWYTEHLIELIKGETKPFLTSSQVGQMVDEMLEE